MAESKSVRVGLAAILIGTAIGLGGLGAGIFIAHQPINQRLNQVVSSQEWVDTMPGHVAMEQLFEKGTYSNLEDLRKDLGYNLMPFITDEATFEKAKEQFEVMDQWMEKNGGRGMMGSRGYGNGWNMMGSGGYGDGWNMIGNGWYGNGWNMMGNWQPDTNQP